MHSLILLLVLASTAAGRQSQSPNIGDLVEKFRPGGVKIEAIVSVDPSTNAETRAPAVATGRLEKTGGRYLAFIYSKLKCASETGCLMLRVVQDPEGKALVLDQSIPGTFLWMQDFKTNGFQIIDLNCDGVDEIVTITSEGASLGAELNIFAVREGSLVSILSKPNGYALDGYRFEFQQESGKYAIVIYGKDGNQSQTLRWDGREFRGAS
jgi:hypothetical protein